VRSVTGPSKKRKLSRKGRHSRPSQVQKAARRAGLAAPALAVSGALVAAGPQALTALTHHAHPAGPAAGTALDAGTALGATGQARSIHLDTTARPTDQATRVYEVHAGDTLAGIAQQFYGHSSDWAWLFAINHSKISNPGAIYAGEVLSVPADPPASVANGTYRPRHAEAASDPAPTAIDTASASPAQSSSGGSSGSLGAQIQQAIASGNNLTAIALYLVQHGYSHAAAAGIASCIDGESQGNPESMGDGGGGLIGWTPLGSAAPSPNIVTGNVAQDLMTQLGDILYYNSSEIGQSQVDQLNSIGDPVAAADFYSQNFERPSVTDSDVVPSVAEQIFAALGG
jgi:LysM repeat protein